MYPIGRAVSSLVKPFTEATQMGFDAFALRVRLSSSKNRREHDWISLGHFVFMCVSGV